MVTNWVQKNIEIDIYREVIPKSAQPKETLKMKEIKTMMRMATHTVSQRLQ